MDAQSAQPRRGFRDAAGSAVRSAADLARARTELLLLEASEARRTSSTLSRFAGVGLVCCAAGYTLLLTAAAHYAGTKWFGGDYAVPALALAAFHIFVGTIALLAARARLRRARFFDETLEQFQQDRQWLTELQRELRRSD